LWAIIFHRKRGDQLPRQVRYNLPIEILYTVLPFIMVGVMFYFTARDENYITKVPSRHEIAVNHDVVVNVIGEQWSWQFQYPQYGTPNSPYGYPAVTETGEMWQPGVPLKNQHLPLLEIPEHKTVVFNLTSIDVIHAFWVPSFDFKRDVIPGFTNRFAFTAIKTGSEIGNCTELCGVFHSRMLFRIKIVTPAQFAVWIHQQQAQQSSPGGVR
jgi:cytochrome c oxidase subunit 2